jgi:hypothetical protein
MRKAKRQLRWGKGERRRLLMIEKEAKVDIDR